MNEKTIVNVSGYLFTNLSQFPLEELKESFKKRCRAMGLKGTVVFSPEGVNIMASGTQDLINRFKEMLNEIEPLRTLAFKYSYSDAIPFTRMLVKIKQRLVPLPVENPEGNPAEFLAPQELKKWLDEGRDFIFVDTRNDYECRLGKFEKAIDLKLKHFKFFGDEALRAFGDYKDKPVVMYCTGGIRCERAGPYLVEKGFKQVYQLKGGILKYFEECGGAHYEGDCFVFDYRTAVNPELQETQTIQCFLCREPLTEKDQADARFEAGVSCPYCYDSLQNQSETARKRIHREMELADATAEA